jgi:SAM-dependent methyltransferase
MSRGYHQSRFAPDAKREVVWRALWRYYFKRLVPGDGCVLDLGCGYGDFINQAVAKRRIALDNWPDFMLHLAPGVEPILANATDLTALPDAGIDFVLASNLFEHLPQSDFIRVLDALRPKLSARGTLSILQPNYRYAYREYFDDYTHISVYSHVSICDLLTAHGYEVIELIPRFLPLTVKSRLPVSGVLIGAYLASPIKPLGKQMMVRARPVQE